MLRVGLPLAILVAALSAGVDLAVLLAGMPTLILQSSNVLRGQTK